MITINDIVFLDEEDGWLNYQLEKELTVLNRPFMGGETALLSIYHDVPSEAALESLNNFLEWISHLEEPVVSYYREHIGPLSAEGWYEDMDIYGIYLLVPHSGKVAANISCGTDQDESIVDIELHDGKIINMSLDI